MAEQTTSYIIGEKLKKVKELRDMGLEPYGRFFDKKDSIKDILDNKDDESRTFITAGRIVSYRRMGKNGFAHLKDQTGKIQFYVSKNEVGEDEYEIFKNLSVGDFIGLSGTLFYTQTGELTIRAKKYTVLSKNIRPLPDKVHGLTDVDLRYRQRYVDLIMNDDVMETMKKRFQIVNYIRKYLTNKGFYEVETPMLHPLVSGAAAKPFKTFHNALDQEMYLRIAPELYLKRLLVGGFEKVFEINRSFRNEGLSIKHNPEFTMMELYQAYADFNTMMDLTEDLISSLTYELYGKYEIEYDGQTINLAKPWKRIKMADIVKEKTGFDIEKIQSDEEAINFAKSLDIELDEKTKYTKYGILNLLFEEKVENTLINPTFITTYPKEISPLSKNSYNSDVWVDRFELFMTGREYGNAYSELNDPVEQKARFADQVEKKNQGDDEACDMDLDYIRALEYGMPPAGGLGIGIDRLTMLITNSYSIKDVILFPTLKKEKHID